MSEGSRIAVVGAGPNGLVAACYLAKAGFKPVVLERRDKVGGLAVTEEFAPGFRCSSVLHVAGPFLPSVAKDLGLAGHGLSWIQSEVRVLASGLDGKGIRLYGDAQRTAAELEKVSPHDAKGYLAFQESLTRIGRVLEPLMTMTPPSIDDPSFGEMWEMFGVGRRFRALPRRDAFRLLRWGPMAVADLVSEFFENELLRAAIAARGIYGCFAGPWSAGTSLGVLLQAASDANAAGPSAIPQGGMGALTQALAAAAKALGAEIRTNAEVARIQTKDGAATGVVISSPLASTTPVAAPTPSAPCSAWSIRSTSTRTSSSASRTTGPRAPWRRSTSRSRSSPTSRPRTTEPRRCRAASTSAPTSITSSARTTPPSTAISRLIPTATSRSRR